MEQREERSKSVCFEAPGHLVDCGPAGAGWNLGLLAFPSLLGCRSRLFCSLEPCKDCTVFSQLWQGYKAWPLPTLYFCKIPVFLASRARLACIRCSLLFFFFLAMPGAFGSSRIREQTPATAVTTPDPQPAEPPGYAHGCFLNE